MPALLGCCVLAQQTQHGVVLWKKGMQLSPGWRVALPKVGGFGLAAWVLGRGSCLVGGVQLGDPSLVSLAFCTVFRGKVVLGYTETELCRRGSGYQFVHAADMMHCAENHVRSECQGGAAALAGGGGPSGLGVFGGTLMAPWYRCSSGHAGTVAPWWAVCPESGAAVKKALPSWVIPARGADRGTAPHVASHAGCVLHLLPRYYGCKVMLNLVASCTSLSSVPME